VETVIVIETVVQVETVVIIQPPGPEPTLPAQPTPTLIPALTATPLPDLPGGSNAKCPPQAKAEQCLAFWLLLWMP
jgi:hypothetical protein